MKANEIMRIVKKYAYIFVLASVIGWVYELYIFWYHGEGIINRGFLFGPYLPVYGFGGVIVIALLRKLIKKKIKIWKVNITPIMVFILIGLITTLVEYVAHFILDNYFGILLWDYSKEFLNLNGRVCFNASFNFAIVGVISVYIVIPIFEKIGKKLKEKQKDILLIVFLLLMLIDFIITLL